MSTTIDQRVVEMRFDNSNFEKNTRETMSTLDRLKQKLNLSGASKGLENLSSSANKVNMNGLANAVGNVTSRFSALEIMGVTALVNLTNSAVNAGKRMISALTIDPVKTGFQEYETQLNSVQTIMANVGHKGKTLQDVNKALDELNEYADQTIYNFTEMTRNIGLFTNAGVDLDTSVAAIKGFSNAAAMAGTDATSTARAMYQLSQAFSSGSVKLLDWRSLETANITGERFQETVKMTAKVHGINVDAMIKKEGSFRETLKSGWLTSELMAEALNHYTLSRESMTEADQKAAKQQLRSIGYTEEQIEKLFDLGTEASNAATKVKTFTQLWGVLQESAQSGWAKTWQIIIGDFEQAKAFFTPLANFLTGVIDKISDARNKFLSAALGNPFSALMDKLDTSGMLRNIKGVSKGLEYYQEMTTSVWRGDWKNQPYRKGLLEDEGHNFSVIQSLVNKGYLYKLTLEDVAEAEAKYGITAEKTTHILEELTDAKLKEAGLTESEIKLYRRLEEQAKKTGKPISELIESMENRDGRTLLIESLTNAGNGLVGVFTALGKAWREIFPAMDSLDFYFFLEGLNEFSKSLVLTDETGQLNENGQKIQRIFKGIAAIVDTVLTLTMGPLGVALKLTGQLFKALDIPVLDFLANFADAIVIVHDMAAEIFDFGVVFEVLAPMLKDGIANMKEWFKSMPDSKWFNMLKTGLKNMKLYMADFLLSLKDISKDDVINFFKKLGDALVKLCEKINTHFNGVPAQIASGLVNGLKEEAKSVVDGIVNLAKLLIEKFKEVLGIHSPSTVFFMIGSFIVAGLVGGLLAGGNDLSTALSTMATRIKDFFVNIDWGKLFAGGISVGLLLLAKNIIDIINNLSGPMSGIGDLLSGVGKFLTKTAGSVSKILKQTAKVVKEFKKVVFEIGMGIKRITKSIAFEHRAKAFESLAKALLMLVGAVVILTFIEPADLGKAVATISALSLILLALYFGLNAIANQSAQIEKGKIKISGLQTTLLSLGLALLSMMAVIKMLGGMDPEQYEQGMRGLLGIVAGMVALMFGIKMMTAFSNPEDLTATGKMLRKLAYTLLLMVGVIKLCRFLDINDAIKGGLFMAAFILFVKFLVKVTTIGYDKQIAKVGGMLLAMSVSMLLLIAVMKLVNVLEPGEFWNGIVFLTAFILFIKFLVKITTIGNDSQMAKVGGTLLGITTAMLLMVGVIKLVNLLTWDEFLNGVAFMGVFVLFVWALVAVTKISNEQQMAKVGGTLLAMSVAIGILVGVIFLLSLIEPTALVAPLIVIGALGLIMMGLVKCTKGARNVYKNLLAMAGAIAIMAIAIAALSFIDWRDLIAPTLGMGLLMGMFALIELASKDVTSSFGTLITMVAALGVMAIAIGILGKLPWEQTIAAAGAMSILMLAMTGALFLLSKMSLTAVAAVVGVGGLLALCAPLAAIAKILNKMENANNATASAKALSLLLGVMTGVLTVLSLIGSTLSFGALIGATVLLALCVPLNFMVKILTKMNEIDDAMGNAAALSLLLITMAGVLTVLAFVGPLAYTGIAALGALTLVIIAIGALVMAIGSLMEKYPQLQTFLDTGINALIQLADGLGRMIGAFVNGVASQIASGLPAIGSNLSLFMANLQGFITGIKSLGDDDAAIKGVGTLVAAILGLTVAGFLSGLAALYSFGLGSLVALGAQLTLFAEGAKGFFDIVSTIDPSSMDAVKSLAEAISILVTAGFLEAFNLLGDGSLKTFGTQLKDLGTGLVDFVATVEGLDSDKVETARNAAEIIKILAAASTAIPNTGGKLAELIGDNDLGTFANQLPKVGEGVVGFVKAITTGGITADATSTANIAANVIETLAKASSAIPNTGGKLAELIGDNDLGKFASELPRVGTGIVGFIKALTEGGVTSEAADTAKTAAGVIETLAKASAAVPNTGGLLAELIGDNDLSTFATKLPDVGKGIVGFANELGEFGTNKINTIASACEAITTIANLGKIDIKDTGSKLKSFGEKMVDFAKELKSFASKVGEVGYDSINAAISKVNSLISMAKTVADSNITSLTTFGTTLKQFAKDGVNGFVDELGKKDPKDKVNEAGKKLIDEFIDGIDKKKDDVTSKAKEVPEKAINGLNDYPATNTPAGAGKNLVLGFVGGINSNSYLATNAGSSLGKAALNAAKAALKEHSPSKAFYEIGEYGVIGFVNALRDGNRAVYESGFSMAELANKGLSKAITSIADLINSDIDAQPTIRPILDLSDVESGAGYLNTMFNNGPSVGVMANLKSISAGVNARLQNGVNDDVILAIDKLRKDLSNIGGDTYNVGNVSYDDGSAVSNAVRELVRATKVEGRI